jgi:hypothetical protein
MTAAQITHADVAAFAFIGDVGSLRPDRTPRESNRTRGTSELRHTHTRRAVSIRTMHTEALSMATVEPGVRFKSP